MSDYANIVDGIEELLAGISELDGATFYKYAPMAPEELQPNATRCVAIWPQGELVESVDTFTFGHVLSRQSYVVLIWESASDSERLTTDEQAVRDFLDLSNAVRDALITKATTDVANVLDLTYTGSRIQSRAGQVRWLEADVTASVVLNFDNGA